MLHLCSGIICGLYAIHAAQRICGDLVTSMYVTEDGQGKIFYSSGEKFSKSQAQKDVDDLLYAMESVISLICPRTRNQALLLQEFEDFYKLPDDLCHFFGSLNARPV